MVLKLSKNTTSFFDITKIELKIIRLAKINNGLNKIKFLPRKNVGSGL